MLKSIQLVAYAPAYAFESGRAVSITSVDVHDLDLLASAGLEAADSILLTGCLGADDLQRCDVMLAVQEAQQGLAEGAVRVLASVCDSADACLRLRSFAGCSPRLAGVSWNRQSFLADIGAEAGEEFAEQARMRVVLAARASGVPAFDSALAFPTPEFRKRSMALGFKGAIVFDR